MLLCGLSERLLQSGVNCRDTMLPVKTVYDAESSSVGAQYYMGHPWLIQYIRALESKKYFSGDSGQCHLNLHKNML